MDKAITKTRKGENTKEEGDYIKTKALFRLSREIASAVFHWGAFQLSCFRDRFLLWVLGAVDSIA
jgi:hypothetical protein